MYNRRQMADKTILSEMEAGVYIMRRKQPYYDAGREARYPHADDALERMYAEDGFAAGWAPHQKPVPAYFFDNHIHYGGPKDATAPERLISALETWEELGALRALVIFNVCGDKKDGAAPAYAVPRWGDRFSVEEAKELLGTFFGAGRCFWSAWLDHNEPNPGLVHAAADAGFHGIKLHNAPVIEANAPHDVWLSDQWRETFKAIGERKLPVLFHVTQRLPGSAYTGGGRNTYWTAGWDNGAAYGNEDLLQSFLTCCRRCPDVDFIGAHQLHIGWERLDELFTGLPNLYVDTTVGCTLRLYDDFYPHDKEYLRDVFIKWADRILFGTDSFWGDGARDQKPGAANLARHMRFITSLDLPGGALDKICRSNMERLYRIPPMKK